MKGTNETMKRMDALLRQDWEKYAEIRHHLHAHPEKSNQEKETAAYLTGWLRRAGIPCRTGLGGYGIIADIGTERNRPTVAIRADMDALALSEASGLPFASQTPGVMHACGHDVHMSALLTAGLILQQVKESLSCGVRLIFQPAEENGPVGGAVPMISDGALDGADIRAVFAAHAMPQIPEGAFAVVKGPALAANDNFYVTVTGKGGHAAMPHACVNPLLAASQLVLHFCALPAQEICAHHAAVISVGKYSGGIRHNIIPEKAELEGTMRTFDPKDREKLMQRMDEISCGIARSSQTDIRLVWQPSFPMGANEPYAAQYLRNAISRHLGKDLLMEEFPPFMGSDDFAYFLRERPGAILWVGTGIPGRPQELHSPELSISDNVLKNLCRAFLAVAIDFPDFIEGRGMDTLL